MRGVPMAKILFVAQNFQIGGVQKALTNMLKVMDPANDIHLFVFGDGPLLNEVPDNVTVTHGNRVLRLMATPFRTVIQRKNPLDVLIRSALYVAVRIIGSHALYRMVMSRQRIKEHFDIAISYFTDVPGMYFNQGTNQFVIDYTNAPLKATWIHNDPIDGEFDVTYCQTICEKFDHVVCVSKAVRDKMALILPAYEEKFCVYHNQFPEDEIREKAQAYNCNYGQGFHIVTVGRVDNLQKRTDEIVRLCLRLKENGIREFCWHIVGDGPDLQKDKALAEDLGVNNLVVFEGAQNNPYPHILAANIFALYSAFEGFPMVIGEAQALGKYILTTNYAAAHEQIAPHQGYIADSDEEFFNKLKEIILLSRGEQ